MRLLLDTHVALWAICDDARLSGRARGLIADTKNTPYVSAASLWEIAIKHNLKPEAMPVSAPEARHWFGISGYRELAVSGEHASYVQELPDIHADPFDRMLVAQALCEPLRLVTRDSILPRYSDTVILV